MRPANLNGADMPDIKDSHSDGGSMPPIGSRQPVVIDESNIDGTVHRMARQWGISESEARGIIRQQLREQEREATEAAWRERVANADSLVSNAEQALTRVNKAHTAALKRLRAAEQAIALPKQLGDQLEGVQDDIQEAETAEFTAGKVNRAQLAKLRERESILEQELETAERKAAAAGRALDQLTENVVSAENAVEEAQQALAHAHEAQRWPKFESACEALEAAWKGLMFAYGQALALEMP